MENGISTKEIKSLTTTIDEEDDLEQQQQQENENENERCDPEMKSSTTEHIKCSFSIESPTPTPTTNKPHDAMVDVKLEEDDTESDDTDPTLSKTTYREGKNNRDEDLDSLLALKDRNCNDSSDATIRTTLNEIADEDLTNYEHRSLCNKILCCCRSSHSSSSESPFQVGNSIILNSYLYRRFSVCIIGPTWPGCIFTVGLLYFSSYYFIHKALNDVGFVSAMFCIGFTIWSTVSLFFVSCCDPGIVRNKGADGGSLGGYHNVTTGEDEGWSYCDFCSVYQPPTAAHCPECNVCVEGYDHHCPWMGKCIGKGNMKAFMSFNFSWMFYLLYSLIWIAAVGPSVKHQSE